MRSLRLWLAVPAGLVVVVLAWSGWQAWQVSKSLAAAAVDASALQSSIDSSDPQGIDAALARLQDHAGDADDRTSGRTWSLLTHVPVFGDDARGVRTVSSVMADLTGEGFEELADSAGDLDSYAPRDGKLPLDALEQLQDPVARASAAFDRADERLSAEDSSGYLRQLRTSYDDLAQRVADADHALATADKALGLLPGMLGREGPRDYLLVFQNNAEIRAGGGLPGAWALLHADAGQISITKQGTAGDFPNRDGQTPILPISAEESRVYGEQLGTYYQDANFTPDFPRSAELWTAWWAASFSQTTLDGVLSFDPVAMSYLLGSTGPVQVGDVQLTPDNAVAELLNKPYLDKDATAQDAFFAQSARAVFDAVTGGLQSPVEFLRALERGADEGRLHVAPSDEGERGQLAGTAVAGALATDDGDSPHVEVTVDDATGSKMSYYLRYRAAVDARGCSGGVQSLLGTMSLSQSITAAEAAALPVAVTGGGQYGTAAGHQLVVVRLYSPTGGTLDDVKLDGMQLDSEVIDLDDRQLALVVAELSGPDDVLLTWSMQSGKGQTGDGTVGVTPSVAADNESTRFGTGC